MITFHHYRSIKKLVLLSYAVIALLHLQEVQARLARVSPLPLFINLHRNHGKSKHTNSYTKKKENCIGFKTHKINESNLSLEATSALQGVKFKNFQEMLDNYSDCSVLVSFSSRVCGPCKLMKEELNRVRQMVNEDKVKIFSIDTDRFPHLGSRYEVEGESC